MRAPASTAVDETRPVVETGFVAAGAGEGHCISALVSASQFAPHSGLDSLRLVQLFSGWRAIRSSSLLISLFCSPWPSAHSRIICCSVRICATSPWMASARLAIAAVVLRLAPPSSTAVRAFERMLQPPPTPAPAVAGIFAHGRGEPVFEVGVEAVLRLARLQIEKAEDQRAGEAEQRRRKRDAHASERRGEAFLQRVEQRAGIAADLQSLDHLADRADGFDQAPERAEQAEKNQQAGHVARDVARLIEAGGDRIEQMPHGLLREDILPMRSPPRRRHRRQQERGSAPPQGPGSARRKLFTQATSGNSRST